MLQLQTKLKGLDELEPALDKNKLMISDINYARFIILCDQCGD
jgi:hypothetical protein